MKIFRNALHGFGTLVYPVVCIGCGLRVEDPVLPLCPGCIRTLERAEDRELRRELDRLPAEQEAVDEVFALWVFDKGAVVQAVQHRLKYGNRPRLGLGLGRLMAEGWRERGSRVDVLVPVPLARLRRLQRGYNQSAWLARGMGDRLDCPVLPDAMRRVRETRTQTRLSVAERIRNTQGAFAVSAVEDVQERAVMVVDDVLTTGATGLAAARALKEAGASRVILGALAFARPV